MSLLNTKASQREAYRIFGFKVNPMVQNSNHLMDDLKSLAVVCEE